MNNKPWFHAQIRWAVLQEGKRGLLYWKESAYLFQSEDHQTGFQQALEMGRRHEQFTREGRRLISTRLVEIVTLDCLGSSPPELLFEARCEKATEYLPFEHVFKPEDAIPPSSF
jgi:hypothetical protein